MNSEIKVKVSNTTSVLFTVDSFPMVISLIHFSEVV